MLVNQARATARRWVTEHASARADFCGAFFSGSTAASPAGDEVPKNSDIDVFVALSGKDSPLKPGKFSFDGVLMEVTYIALSELSDAQRVAESYHLAHTFSRDAIISDPTGQLRRLHEFVSRTFTDPVWIERRCEDALTRIDNFLRGIDGNAPWHNSMMSWLFATGVTTHVVLVAALQNPTVRLRY